MSSIPHECQRLTLSIDIDQRQLFQYGHRQRVEQDDQIFECHMPNEQSSKTSSISLLTKSFFAQMSSGRRSLCHKIRLFNGHSEMFECGCHIPLQQKLEFACMLDTESYSIGVWPIDGCHSMQVSDVIIRTEIIT
jgi:hypothetical protein